jgi:hypothetical protein
MVNRFIISIEIGVEFLFLIVHHSRWDRDG